MITSLWYLNITFFSSTLYCIYFIFYFNEGFSEDLLLSQKYFPNFIEEQFNC